VSQAELTSAAVSQRMSRQRRRDTAPELALRSELHRLGLRYRLQIPVPDMKRRTIDIAFRTAQVAVFVDGCFWHGCPEHGTSPLSNGPWWESKLATNQARDRETDAHLLQCGWRVRRVWEHESPAEVALELYELVRLSEPPGNVAPDP
jgi:DNA mismatch endonuclease (patch repair protein)